MTKRKFQYRGRTIRTRQEADQWIYDMYEETEPLDFKNRACVMRHLIVGLQKWYDVTHTHQIMGTPLSDMNALMQAGMAPIDIANSCIFNIEYSMNALNVKASGLSEVVDKFVGIISASTQSTEYHIIDTMVDYLGLLIRVNYGHEQPGDSDLSDQLLYQIRSMMPNLANVEAEIIKGLTS